LNAAIRAVVRVATRSGDEIVGFHHGWRGVVDGEAGVLTVEDTRGILLRGGTILHTARFHPDEHEGGREAVLATVARLSLDALIVIGGDGTLGAAHNLARAGLPLVGIPKTIDNDVSGTQCCIGFDTAVAVAAEAIDRLATTAESHDRLMVVELMGRSTGWLAACAGIAGGADAICLPERPTDLDTLAKALRRRHDAGSTSSVVVVAEGARFTDSTDEPSSTGALVADELALRTGYETRLTVLGHVQRGGTPTANDRLLATRFGVAAIEAAHARVFGSLVCVADGTVTTTGLEAVASGMRPLPDEILCVASLLSVG
jgi:6-phosphofructokinase 1